MVSEFSELSSAGRLAVCAAGGFFLVGLLSGAWKYAHVARSPDAKAPVYVDITHRAALLYAFACLLIERFVELSGLSAAVELAAVIAQVVFFALAVVTYIVHGLLQDTDNQLRRPHAVSGVALPTWFIPAFMWMLMAAEIGGFAVLLWGVCWGA